MGVIDWMVIGFGVVTFACLMGWGCRHSWRPQRIYRIDGRMFMDMRCEKCSAYTYGHPVVDETPGTKK